MIHSTKLQTPIGIIEIQSIETEVKGISILVGMSERALIQSDINTHVSRYFQELTDYFEGKLQKFTVPIHFSGTPFQTKVWQALQMIPYATTVSYGQIAQQIGHPKAVRAVGRAVGSNPFPIIVPCHRVIGSNGSLTGFAYGLTPKRWLLDHEQQVIKKKTI